MYGFPSITQPIADIPDNTDLPEALHELADNWRAIRDRADDTYAERERIDVIGIPEAQRADQAALQHAARTGAPFPIADEQEHAARRHLDAVVRQHEATGDVLADTGTALAAGIRAHRADIAAIHRPRIEAALRAYQLAIHQARTSISAAAADLGEATAIGALLFDLDLRASDAQPDPLTIPISIAPYDTTPVGNVLNLLGAPAARSTVAIIGNSGIVLHADPDTAAGLIDSGQARPATTDEQTHAEGH